MHKTNFLGALLLIASGAVCAQSQGVPTLGDLAKVTADRIYLTAVAARDEVKRKVEGETGAGVPTGANGATMIPSLRQIITVNGVTTGVFAYSGGMRLEKGVGDTLPGDYKVLSLSPQKLSGELKDKTGRVISIGMSEPVADAGGGQGSSVPSGPFGLPPSLRVPAIAR
ncbi:type IV pilus biogenesis protein PilP [Pandoraea cepalis]|nr:type IV pilus biogenesis protein PilP [Pandoraea cepalis]